VLSARARWWAALGREDGLTLAEVLVGLIVIGALVTAFAGVAGMTVTDSTAIAGQGVLETQARDALDELTDDIRQALPPSASATSAFVTTGGTMSPTSLSFYSPDRAYSSSAPTSYQLQEISYQLSGGNLQRSVTTSTNTGGPPWTWPATASYVTLVSGVTSLSFTYYTAGVTTNGVYTPPQTTTNPASVATVVVALTASGSSDQSITYSDSATIRVAA
jgi:Tfp pilus assembly protein PilV